MEYRAVLKISGAEPNGMRIIRGLEGRLKCSFKKEGDSTLIDARGPIDAIQELKRRVGGKRCRKSKAELVELECTQV